MSNLKSEISNLKFQISDLRYRDRTAFTLIEILIAIALVVALIGTMYGFLFDMLSARSRVLEHVQRETAASALIKQLDTDLATCIVGDRAFGSGVAGDHHSIRVLSRGVAAHLAARGTSDPDVFGDLQLAEYRFNEGERRLEGRRAAIGGSSAASSPFTPLQGAVHFVRFRYHDGERWLSRFDSMESNRLPLAVEVAIWFRPPIAPDANTDALTVPPDEPSDALLAEDNEPALDDETDLIEADEAETYPVPPDRVRVFLIPDASDAEESLPEGEVERE